MSAPIKQYSLGGFNNGLVEDADGHLVSYDDHIASHRFDEAKERELFEAWHKERYPAVKIRVQNLLGTYTDMQVECNFETWLACARSRAERFAGGAE